MRLQQLCPADDRSDRKKPRRPQVKQIIWLTNRSINETLINEFPNSSLFIDISRARSLALTSPIYTVQHSIYSFCLCTFSPYVLCLWVSRSWLDYEALVPRNCYVLRRAGPGGVRAPPGGCKSRRTGSFLPAAAGELTGPMLESLSWWCQCRKTGRLTNPGPESVL